MSAPGPAGAPAALPAPAAAPAPAPAPAAASSAPAAGAPAAAEEASGAQGLLQQSVLPALSEIQGAEQAARQHGDELAQTLHKVQELQGQLTHLSRKADAAFTQLVAEQSTLQLLQGPLKDDPAAVGCVTACPARAPQPARAPLPARAMTYRRRRTAA